jgi:DNA polymerase-3 subunit gamma/tau
MADIQASHLVLARKWRPERFSELVGQEHVTRTLTEALRRGRIAHAFLFTGIRGVGKTTAARILARCLNCEKGPTPEPCGECPACVEIRAGRALDVSEIDGATYRKIDDARAIIENLGYRPARDRFKIYIIDEAHQLTDQAFNALLKTLEEPPPHVKFILATTEPQKMPETILSRLQRYDFRRIPLATIFARLKDLAAREGVEAEESALMLLARESGGSMRDAERMLETALAAASDGKVVEAEVAASLGVASRSVVYSLLESILKKDASRALSQARELYSRGANLESLGRDLLESLRNLAVAKLPETDSMSPLTDLPDHEAAHLRRLAAEPSNRDLMRLFHLMADAQEQIMRSPYPDLLLEMALVRMATLAPVMDADELLRAIRANGQGASGAPPASSGGAPSGSQGTHARRIKVEGEVNAQAPARPELAPVRVAAPVADSAGLDLPDLRAHIRARRAALAGFMEQGAALSIAGDTLKVTARNEIYIRYLADNRATLAELASEFYGRPFRVELVSDVAAPAEASAPSPAPAVESRVANQSAGAKAQNARAAASPEASAPPDEAASPGFAAMMSEASKNVANGSSKPQAASRARTANAEERQAVLSDPEMRPIFDALEARLVEVRISDQAPAADEPKS